jgi:PAS domain S-box-containing protein
MNYSLDELIDIEVFQSIQDRLNDIYAFPSAIIDNNGKILTATAWQDACTKFHRANKECEQECIKSDQYIQSHLSEANPTVSYKCVHGLIDNATPIIINGKHLGNFFTGQFFLEKPDLSFFKGQAKRFNFNEGEYLKAIEKVPVKTQDQLKAYLFLIDGLIELIVSIANKKLKEIESEKKILESEERFKSIFENSNQGIVIIDVESRQFIMCNSAFSLMLGYNIQEVVKLSITNIHPVDHFPEVIKKFTQIINKEISIARNIPVQKKNGEIIYCDISGSEIFLENKQYFAGLFHDVTDGYIASLALLENEKKYRTIVENINDALIIHDFNNVIIDVNENSCNLLGYSRNELLGFPLSKVSGFDNQMLFSERMEKLKYESKIIFEGSHIHKDGHKIDTEVSSKMISINGNAYVQAFIRDITERKKIEKRIVENEENYRIISQLISDYIFKLVVSEDGSVTMSFVSDAFSKGTGRSLDEVSDVKTWSNIIHPDEKAKFFELLSNLIKNGGTAEHEGRFLKKGGDYRWVHVNVEAQKNASTGKVYSIIGAVSDITEKKLAEETLEYERNLLRTVIDNIPDRIYAKDNEFRFLLNNKAHIEALGVNSIDDALGKTDFDFRPAAVANKYLELDKKVIETGQAQHNYEEKVLLPSGKEAWLLMSKIPLKDYSGTTKGLIGISRDITKQKESELKIRQSEFMLAKSQSVAKIGSYYFNIPTGKWTSSKALDEIFGIDENFDRSIEGWISFTHPEHKELMLDHLINYVIAGKNQFNQEYKIIRNGEECWVHGLGELEFDENGNPIWMIGTIQDISTRKHTELQLIEAKERAEESDRLKTAFLQNMSHEIRTPMNAIMGFSEILSKQFGDREKLEKYTGIIVQRCKDLLELINEILDVAKIESGQLTIYEEECNIRNLFNDLKTVFKEYSLRNNKLNIDFCVVDECFTAENIVITDEGKLKQIFINLIENAYKFTQKGKIEIGCEHLASEKYVFYVSDTGIGIPKDKHDIIFDRFIQVSHDTSRLYGGTGLGLSIVKGLINLLKGKIWLESEPENGTTFYFTIPLKFSKNTFLNLKNQTINIKPDVSGTILIVEDEVFNAEYLQEIFSNTNYKTIFTDSGYKSVEIATTNEIDLVLMDIRLYDLNGYDATRMIKAKKPNLKILALTAYAAPSDEQKAIDAGCDAYISKPVNAARLIQKINDIISQGK